MNEDNINNIYNNNNFKSKETDDFSLKAQIDKFSMFLSYGAPKTRYENLSQKKLIDTILEKGFSSLPDEIQCEVFQEFHNRLAKRLGIPAINVYVLTKKGKDGEMACVTKRSPLNLMYETNGELYPNLQLNIDNKQNFGFDISGITLTPSTNGLENISTLIHETRHVAQSYAQSCFNRVDQLRNENELNAVSYFKMMSVCFSRIGISVTPQNIVKNKYYIDATINFAKNYLLRPEEIDARRFAFKEMERLAQKGYLDNTNWNTYRGKYLIDEFEALNFFKFTAGDECPAIRYLKEEKRLINKALDKNYKLRERTEIPKDLINLEKSIDFDKFYDSIQNYYNDLKLEIQQIMVEESRNIAENSKYSEEELDDNYYYKLRYGSSEVCNVNDELFDVVKNQYLNEHKPLTKKEAEEKNLNNYKLNKKIKKEREEFIKDMAEAYKNIDFEKQKQIERAYEYERE